jgi:dUTPase
MIYFNIVDPKGKPPTRTTTHSAGWDLYMPETVLLLPGERAVLDLGVSFRLPPDCAGLISLRPCVGGAHQIHLHPSVIGN